MDSYILALLSLVRGNGALLRFLFVLFFSPFKMKVVAYLNKLRNFQVCRNLQRTNLYLMKVLPLALLSSSVPPPSRGGP